MKSSYFIWRFHFLLLSLYQEIKISSPKELNIKVLWKKLIFLRDYI